MELFLFAPLLAFAVTLIMLWLLLRHRIAQMIVDRPNERSLHRVPTPRVGGIALMAGIAAGWIMAGSAITWPLFAATGLLIALSLVDDWHGLPIVIRLAVQALVAAGYLLFEVPELKALAALLVAWLAMLWMINLYNFMDGSDGLAGGMALFGFGAYGLAAWLGGNQTLALLSLCVSAAAVGFLIFNFHPAKVFMGDAGSIPLGFLAAALGLAGIVQGVWPMWFPAAVFAPFIVDATVTLFRRLMQGEKIWRAHRTHYYQRLVQMGWGHRGTALVEYALMGLTGMSAVLAVSQPVRTQGVMLATLGLVYFILMIWIDRSWANFVKRGSGGNACE